MTLINGPEVAFSAIQASLALMQNHDLPANRVKMIQQTIRDYSKALPSMEFGVEEVYRKRVIKHIYTLRFDATSELIISINHNMIAFVNDTLDVKLESEHYACDVDFLSHIESLRDVIEMHNLDLPYVLEVIDSTLTNIH